VIADIADIGKGRKPQTIAERRSWRAADLGGGFSDHGDF
jgi:hypothetical protein